MTPSDAPRRHARETISDSVPSMTKTASAAAIGARTGPPRMKAISATKTTKPPAKATASRSATPSRSPRFQASEKPNGVAKAITIISTPAVRLKNGAPTVIFSPVTCSSASG